MCFKKKKIILEVPEAKYKLNCVVQLMHHNDLKCGFVRSSKKNENGEIIYDINVGGECPFLILGVKEEELRPFIR